jgi:hypothetical protein
LLSSQIDTLEEPDPSEDPLIIDEAGPSARTPGQLAEEIIRGLCTCAIVTPSAAAPLARKFVAKRSPPVRNPH